ncbi:MAG: hypothetical protein IKC73_01935, partial [Clostridia bacterium]|nr:hypothetical protein [Clostridia bacterium]
MSIQKITKSELLSMGVQSLPNRPSSPSLYSGRTLSATELKAAFDRLPTLIAERFNALLDATGLYTNEGTYERLAELIATDIEEAPSLAAFFEDVKNGNLALYLSADGEASLSAVIEELRCAILRLQSTSFLMEGDGDIVSGVSVEEPFITLHKDIKSDDIVAKANRYTDAPRGAVAEGCTLPVSGGRVARAIAEVDAKTDHSLGVRVEALEKAAQGVLYSYPVQDAAGETIFVTKEALPYGAVCRLGGTLPSSRNLLSENTLTTYRSDTLRIDWDDENACLVFNGTLTPEEGEVHLAVFRADATPIEFVGGIFYRGGSLCGAGAVSLSFRTQDGASFSLPFLEADSTSTFLYLETSDESFDAICISTTEPVVFDGYRCNICLEKWNAHDEVVYSPCDSKIGRKIPATITSVGHNLFTGDRRYRGKGAVTIEVNCPARNCQLVISYHAVSASQRAHLPFRITWRGGSSSVASKPYGSRQAYSFFSSDYVKSITFTDTSTDENGDPYEIEIRDFQIEQVEPKVKTARPYSEP